MRFLGLLATLLVAMAYRFPYWINAASLNSDHAIVGLQARAILRGEWSWYLWGVGYQSSFEPLLTAGFFRMFGDSPQSLAAIGIFGFLLICTAIYGSLSRELPPIRSFLLTLFAVFTVGAVTQITVFPPRIWSITFMAISFYLIGSRNSLAKGGGAFLSCFSLYIDYYAIQLLPAAVLFLYLRKERVPNKNYPSIMGFFGGLLFLGIARWLRPEGGVPLAFSPKTFSHNVPLLTNTVLPVLGGYAANFFGQANLGTLWQPIAKWSAAIFAFLLLLSPLLPGVKPGVRTLSWVGACASFTSLIGFCGSSMASDIHSVRFLSIVPWVAPFTLASLGYCLRKIAFVILILPVVLAQFFFGWNSLAPHTQDMQIATHSEGLGIEEKEIINELRNRGVRYAQAQFWVAYRLSFLSHDNPIVIPDAEFENRYLPYWKAYQATSHRAAILKNGDRRSEPEFWKEKLRRNHTAFEEKKIGNYTLIFWEIIPESDLQTS